MRHERDWLLLGTAADLSAARELLPGLDAVAISTQGERPFDVDPLDGRLLTADELLVVTAHGEGHAQIEAALRQRGRTDALFLEGGLVAYQTYVEHQQRLARPMSGNEAYGAQCAAARDGS